MLAPAPHRFTDYGPADSVKKRVSSGAVSPHPPPTIQPTLTNQLPATHPNAATARGVAYVPPSHSSQKLKDPLKDPPPAIIALTAAPAITPAVLPSPPPPAAAPSAQHKKHPPPDGNSCNKHTVVAVNPFKPPMQHEPARDGSPETKTSSVHVRALTPPLSVQTTPPRVR
jgi:hypothetical protein